MVSQERRSPKDVCFLQKPLLEHPQEKRCSKCGELKEITEFHYVNKAKGYRRGDCKDCALRWHKGNYQASRLHQIERKKIHYRNNVEAKRKYNKDYSSKNRKTLIKKSKEYYDNNRAGILEKKKIYWKDNQLAIQGKYKLWRRRNHNFRVYDNIRRRINKYLNRRENNMLVEDLLGCTMESFISYLTSKLKEGMTLENYGKWHIDHIKPIALFDTTSKEQIKECFHYTNLQPLWARENFSKGAKYEDRAVGAK